MAERKYKSKRLEGLQGKWTDAEVLVYLKEKVDFRTNHPDLKEALDQRVEKIIAKLFALELLTIDHTKFEERKTALIQRLKEA